MTRPALAHDHLTADGPHVALLHAGVADRRVWRDVAPELHALGADVLALDRRGFGETPAGDGDFRHVDDLLEMLDGPTWLVGNSMGGALALDAALVAPEQVAGLVLIATAVSGAPEGSLESLDPDTARIIQAIMAADGPATSTPSTATRRTCGSTARRRPRAVSAATRASSRWT